MGVLNLNTNGSFGHRAKNYSAEAHGHADAVVQAIKWLSAELLPWAIAEDHDLRNEGVFPKEDFRSNK